MTYVAYALHVVGAIHCLVTLPSFFKHERVEIVQWYNSNGTLQSLSLSSAFLTLLAFFKIVYGGIFELYQGSKALELFKGIYQKYVHAESGRTQGIEMKERQSKEIKEHVSVVTKITICQLLIVFVGCGMLKKELDNVATQFVDQIYQNQS